MHVIPFEFDVVMGNDLTKLQHGRCRCETIELV
jgi:hypothetical protein